MVKTKRQPWNPLLCSYPDSDKIDKLSFEAETLYTRLIARSDDNANAPANPTLLMCMVFARRFESGLIDAAKTERLRNELVTVGLIKIYKSNSGEYLHILDCKKHLRADINLDIRYPLYIKEDTVNVSANVSANVVQKSPSTTDTTTDTTTLFCPNSAEFRLSELLLSLILSRKSDFKKPNLQQWAKGIDKMIRIDKRKPENIEAVIRWCQSDNFWQNNILSTDKLRLQFDKLELKKNGQISRSFSKDSKEAGGKSTTGRDFAEQQSKFGTTIQV